MNEIKCPKCGTIFQISESDYESILKQIRDNEFEKELKIREEQYKKEKESAIKIAEMNKEKELVESLNKKDNELIELKNRIKLLEKEQALEIQQAYLKEKRK